MIKYLICFLVILPVPAFAQQISNYNGNEKYDNPKSDQQSNGPIWQILTDIETFFKQALEIGNSQNDKLQQQIDLETQVIQNQNTEIELLKQMTSNPIQATVQKSCHHQGTGVLCQ